MQDKMQQTARVVIALCCGQCGKVVLSNEKHKCNQNDVLKYKEKLENERKLQDSG